MMNRDESVRVSEQVRIPAGELRWEFARASGPGGQNVNRVASSVRLRFDAARSPSLPEDVRQRLLRLAGHRRTATGEILIEARTHRTQERNRAEAMERFVGLLRRALHPARPRRATRPTAASRERRLDAKRRRAESKHARRRPAWSDE
jgi:ribosome-associated protein